VTKRPRVDELVSHAEHVGPVWRHNSSLRETLVMVVIWVLIMVALDLANLLPTAPFVPIEWAAQLTTALVACAPAFFLVEWIYHRLY
jgi:hypothetical protein